MFGLIFTVCVPVSSFLLEHNSKIFFIFTIVSYL